MSSANAIAGISLHAPLPFPTPWTAAPWRVLREGDEVSSLNARMRRDIGLDAPAPACRERRVPIDPYVALLCG